MSDLSTTRDRQRSLESCACAHTKPVLYLNGLDSVVDSGTAVGMNMTSSLRHRFMNVLKRTDTRSTLTLVLLMTSHARLLLHRVIS
jgi:hydroxymethylglutaryl-CoA reductase